MLEQVHKAFKVRARSHFQLLTNPQHLLNLQSVLHVFLGMHVSENHRLQLVK